MQVCWNITVTKATDNYRTKKKASTLTFIISGQWINIGHIKGKFHGEYPYRKVWGAEIFTFKKKKMGEKKIENRKRKKNAET